MSETMTQRRQRAGSSAIALFEANEDDIVAGLEERLRPFLQPGENQVDFRLTLKLLGRLIEVSLDEVLDAVTDDSDDAPLKEFWEAAHDVGSQVIFIRRIFRSLYGPQLANQLLGIKGSTATPQQPELLARQGEMVVARLRNPVLDPPRCTNSIQLDPTAMADELETAVDRLVEAREAALAERCKRDAKASVAADAGRDFDTNFRDSVRLGAGLCRMAGLPELARRLKTSQLRPKPRRS